MDNMRSALKFGILVALCWISIKLLFMALNVFQFDIFVPGLLNNLGLLIAISLGLYFEKKKEGYGEGTALSDIKSAMVAGAPYVLIVSGFMYFYYSDINPTFVETKVSERVDLVYDALQRPTYVDSLRQQTPEFEVMSNDEILGKMKTEISSAYDPTALFTFSLLGLMVLAFTYAIFITIIFRRILLRDYYRNRPGGK